jgi:hypothetical protein
MPIEWVDNEWTEHLMWCPSQLHKRFKYNGKEYYLYLRWRYSDPWTFTIGHTDKDGNHICRIDIFEHLDLFFKDYEYPLAEKFAECLIVILEENKILDCILEEDSLKATDKLRSLKHDLSLSSWILSGWHEYGKCSICGSYGCW